MIYDTHSSLLFSGDPKYEYEGPCSFSDGYYDYILTIYALSDNLMLIENPSQIALSSTTTTSTTTPTSIITTIESGGESWKEDGSVKEGGGTGGVLGPALVSYVTEKSIVLGTAQLTVGIYSYIDR